MTGNSNKLAKYTYKNGVIEPQGHSPIVFSTGGSHIPKEVVDAYDAYLKESRRAIADTGSHDIKARAAWIRFVGLCEKNGLSKNCMEL